MILSPRGHLALLGTLVVTTEKRVCWYLESQGQGCCQTSYDTRNSPHDKELSDPECLVRGWEALLRRQAWYQVSPSHCAHRALNSSLHFRHPPCPGDVAKTLTSKIKAEQKIPF